MRRLSSPRLKKPKMAKASTLWLLKNSKGTVTSVISREQFYSMQSRRFVDSSFEGSLPAFIAAFTKGKRLSKKEAEEIKKMIDEARED